jgi:hypothetical protein
LSPSSPAFAAAFSCSFCLNLLHGGARNNDMSGVSLG